MSESTTPTMLRHSTPSTMLTRLRKAFPHPKALAAVSLVTFALGGLAWNAAREIMPARVATIDLERTFNSLNVYTERQNSLKTLATELEAKVAASETAVKELEAELDSFAPGSPAQATAVQKAQVAVGEFRAVQQFANAKLESERSRILRDTYVDIKAAARKFAEERNLDYILLDDSLPEMDPASATKTMQQISARRFIFAASRNDVTADFIAFMNKSAPTAAQPAAPTGATGG
jgi:Skp family chaperone for outer membrane proteins